MGREAAATEVAGRGRVEGRGLERGLAVLLGELIPGLDDVLAVAHSLAGTVQRGRAGVTQVEQTRGRAALGLPTGGPLDGLGAPVGTHVGEDLRRVRQQVAEQHRGAVKRVVLGGHDGRLADAGPVEVRVEDGLQNVAVGEVVSPLTLTLEAGRDGAVAASLFLEAQLGQARVAVHEVAGDDRHLGDELPPVLVLLGVLPLRRVPVLALLEVLADPLVGLLVLFGVVDALIDAAGELGHVDVFVTHAEVGAEEVGVDDGAGDTHGDGAHGQVGLTLHLRDSQAGGRVVEEAGTHVLGDGGVVSVLHVLAVDAEGRNANLGMASQGSSEVHGAGALGAVEAPDGVRHRGVHVSGLGAVAPAGGDRQGQADVVRAELGGAGLGLVDAADRGVSDDDLDGAAIRVAQVGGEKLGDGLRHVHGLLFERLTNALAATVNSGADSDAGVVCHYSFIPHGDVDVGARGRSPPRIL